MEKMKLNILESDKLIMVWLVLVVAIFLMLMSILTFEELFLLNSENPMWMVHISGGLAFIITFTLMGISNRLNKRRKKNKVDENLCE